MPIIISPSIFFSVLVMPGSTGTTPIHGSPSIRGTISSGLIPLNSFTVFDSICASIIFCPNKCFAFSSY